MPGRYTQEHFGRILRISVKDFMTYDKIDLRTGPGLNLIIGSNGSGKSSLICAICLGLAGKPVFTGRQLKLSEYIKHGCQTAYINIVLCDPSSKNGIKFSRRIHRNGSSEYKINGVSAKECEVEKEVKRFNIQVNNLCQFLPQEKVSEFSKMSKKQLLESMQQTVGDREIHETYKSLLQLRSDMKRIEADITKLKKKLEDNKKENSRLLPEINTYHSREKVKEKIKRLEEKREIMEYSKLYKNLGDIKADVKRCQNELSTFKTKGISELNEQLRKVEQELQKFALEMDSLETDSQRLTSKIISCEREVKNIDNKLYEAKENLINKIEDCKRLGKRKNEVDQQIRAYEANLQQCFSKKKSLKEEINAESAQRSRNINNLAEVEQDILEKDDLISNCILEENKLKQEFRKLSNIELRKMEMLQRINKSTYDAACWLKDNRHRFKRNIMGPLMLLINVPDSRNIKYLENHITKRDMLIFLCDDPDDTKLFTKICRTDMKLAINVACTANVKPLNSYRPEKPKDLYKYRFTSFLKDLFEAPDIVKAFLCEQYRVQDIPIGNEETEKYLTVRGEEVIKEIPFRRFYTPLTAYFLHNSKYGNQNISCNSVMISEKGILSTFASSSQEEKNNIEDSIKRLNEQKQSLLTEKSTLNENKKIIFDLVEKDRQKKSELNKVEENYAHIKQQIEQKKQFLDIINAEFCKFNLEERKKRCTETITLCKKEKMVQFQNLLKYMKERFQILKKKCVLKCYQMSFKGKKNSIENNMQKNKSELTEMEKVYNDKMKELEDLKIRVKKQLMVANQKSGLLLNSENGKEQCKIKYMDLPNNILELDQQKMQLSYQVECMLEIDDSVIEKHRDLEKKICVDEEYLQNSSDELKNLNEDIQKKKQLWLPPLKSLISTISRKFSSYYESLGCAGEISLSQGENEDDFEEYGLSLLVKYRDTVPLRELSQAHHSGGECSVATIIFILSLQELVEVPFRCVDEINQGMDPTNERKIFEFVASSAENSAQYFLLTPKLLEDLPYSRNVIVHLIHNGPLLAPWNVEEALK